MTKIGEVMEVSERERQATEAAISERLGTDVNAWSGIAVAG
jgi:hypothetical protein